MKISKLLATRQSLLRQAHLASLAHAYCTLRRLAERLDLVGLRGPVRLQPASPRDERYWPVLTALEGSQAQLEEHFADNDVVQLVEAVALAVETDFDEIEFDLEDLAAYFAAPLRFALEQAGVAIDIEETREPRPRARRLRTPPDEA